MVDTVLQDMPVLLGDCLVGERFAHLGLLSRRVTLEGPTVSFV